VLTVSERVTMPQRPKSDYNIIPINVRGDKRYVNDLKARAARVNVPLADYARKCLDYAIDNEQSIFFADSGNSGDQNGNGQS
jgi:hypothetical protein